MHTIFTIATPLLAGMVINAQRLQKERDRFLATDPAERDYLQEIQIINEMVLDGTQTFFQRVLDSEVIPSRYTSVKPGTAT